MSKKEEADFQYTICQLLQVHGWQTFEFAKPNSRRKCHVCGAYPKGLGGAVPEGWPDVVAHRWEVYGSTGRTVYLELKVKGRKRTPKQLEIAYLLELEGFPVREVRSEEDVADMLPREPRRADSSAAEERE